MKISINRQEKKHYEKKNIKKHKELVNVILVFFSLCAISILLIFGYDEAMKLDENKKEYTAAFSDTYLNDVFNLDLLETREKSGDVYENLNKTGEKCLIN